MGFEEDYEEGNPAVPLQRMWGGLGDTFPVVGETHFQESIGSGSLTEGWVKVSVVCKGRMA